MSYSASRAHVEWATLVGQAHWLVDADFRLEALATARALCERARRNVDTLVDGLTRSGYVFAAPDAVHVEVDRDAADWIAEFEDLGVHLPIILQAWVLEVGSVNLTGSHPDWPASGYDGLPPRRGGCWYTDALVLEVDHDYLRSEHENWQAQWNRFGPLEVGPFQLPVAPDHIHKANVSGGPACAIDTSIPAVDTLLLYGRDCTSLFHHVSNAFAWGGFPGFAYIDAPLPDSVASLREKMIPL